MRQRLRERISMNRTSAVDAAGCVGLGVLSVLAYCVGLSRNGLGNPFYAAAVQSGAHNLHNAFFAAIDFGGTMSVDKPPMSLWLMEISVRIFGLNSFGELLPNALAGVATTVVVVLIVREWSSLRWGLIAGLLSLASPMATVMFRFNNPEALLTLLTVGTAWCFSSSLRRPAAWKFACAGALIGAAILTKLLAGIVIVPALAAAYALWAPTTRATRLRHLVLLGMSAVASSGWYFAIVAATPPSHRPWIDGTTDDNPFSLLFSSNVGRLVGNGGTASVSPAGPLRMFNHEELASFGPIIVLSVLSAVAVAVVVWRAHREEPRRLLTLVRHRTRPAGPATAAALLNGSALWVCLVMSFIQGGYHSYYAVVSTPILAAGAVLNLALIWGHPTASVRARLLVPVLLGTAAFDVWMHTRYASGWVLDATLTLICVFGIGALTTLRRPRAGLAAVLIVAILLPGVYTWESWRDHHAGGSPLAGPLGAQTAWADYPPRPNNFNFPSRVSPALNWLLRHAGPYEYAVAMQQDEEAGSVQLATSVNVLPLTGWKAVPRGMYARFKHLITMRSIHYFLPTGPRRKILVWTMSHFFHFQVGDQTVYDLTRLAVSHHRHHRRLYPHLMAGIRWLLVL